MKICAVEIKNHEAIVVLASMEQGMMAIHDCRVTAISIPVTHTSEDLEIFQTKFAKLMEDYQVENVVIGERISKGKLAAPGLSFKLEAAIQLITALNVNVLSFEDRKASLKRNPLKMKAKDVGLKPFQEDTFTTAFAFLNMK
ncbi:DUF3010 family protein [Thaumasiovibrio subtropicus]|uniref:DUF3010 family protein n=1 Tax=Thaumasiovibrio subtropicus TaxID=1891207 RepID=UPI000B34BF6B|nr:DUF3010 family protein [Thaumasiovibrio subtropicus]